MRLRIFPMQCWFYSVPRLRSSILSSVLPDIPGVAPPLFGLRLRTFLPSQKRAADAIVCSFYRRVKLAGRRNACFKGPSLHYIARGFLYLCVYRPRVFCWGHRGLRCLHVLQVMTDLYLLILLSRIPFCFSSFRYFAVSSTPDTAYPRISRFLSVDWSRQGTYQIYYICPQIDSRHNLSLHGIFSPFTVIQIWIFFNIFFYSPQHL